MELNNKNNKRLLIGVAILGGAMFVGGIAWQFSGAPTVAGGETSIEAQSKKGNSDVPEGDSTKSVPDDTPDSGEFDMGSVGQYPVSSDAPITDEEGAGQVLEEIKGELGLGDDDTLPVSGQTDDGYGHVLFQTQQHYKGVPVYGTEMVLSTESESAVALIGTWLTDIELDVEPTFTAQEALEAAYRAQGLPESREVIASSSESPRLVVYPADNRVILAWLVVGKITNPDSKPFLHVVNAHEGELIMKVESERL